MKIWFYQWLQRKVSYFLTNKNCIIFRYLINNQNEKGKAFKVRKFVLFMYLLLYTVHCFIKNKCSLHEIKSFVKNNKILKRN